jgi:hypothetical protein
MRRLRQVVCYGRSNMSAHRFEYPDEHADIARLVYKLIDPEMRLPGEPDLSFPSVAEVIAVDPTEAVHSSKIFLTVVRCRITS